MTEKQFDKQLDRLVGMVEKLDPATVGTAFIAFIAENFHESMSAIDFTDIDKNDDAIDYVAEGFADAGLDIGSVVEQLLRDANLAGQK